VKPDDREIWNAQDDLMHELVKTKLLKSHHESPTHKTAKSKIISELEEIKSAKGKVTTRDLNKDKMRHVIDYTRKANGKHNYHQIGKLLGIRNETAKTWVKSFGLIKYNNQRST